MSGDHSPRGPSRLRYGLLGLPLVGLAAAVLLWQPSRPADAAPLTAAAAAGFKTKDKLWVAVNLVNPNANKLQGNLKIELLDKDGQSLGVQERAIDQAERSGTHSFEFPLGDRAGTEGLKLRYAFGGQKFEAAVPGILLAKSHETTVAASREFTSGSPAALRCGVHGVKSFTETVPLPQASVAVRLQEASGKVHDLYQGKTGDDGEVTAEFKVPLLPTGQYKLVVATKSDLGEEKLEQDVRVKSEPRVLLVTDKPLYQPGQLIRIRALCLRPFDLKPVAGSDLTFEVEDPKGNKVFKRAHKTSDFGVAAADFQLADEINLGDYQVRALIGDQQQSQKTVGVKRYVLPKFKAEVTADKKYYLPKETIAGTLQSDYFFGKPVSGGKVKVTASTFDVQFRDFQTWEGKTDAGGAAKFEIKLPDYFVGQPLQKGDALVKLEVKITDTADHTETVTRTYPVAAQPIKLSLIPEGGRLMPGIENRIFAAAIYPDGSPAANCEVKFWKGREGKGKPHTAVKTNEVGLAEFRLTPKPDEMRQDQFLPHTVEMAGGATVQAFGPSSVLDVTAEARDAKGNTAKAVAALNAEPFGENVLLRLDRALYRTGDVMGIEVLTSASLPTAYLDIIKGGQTVLTRWLDVKDGTAKARLDLPPGLFGTLEVHAYQQLASGEIIRDSRVVYVHSRDDLKIEAKADRDTYLPGQEGKIRFQVTDTAGKPTAAALGLIIVDEAVYALQELQPGLEKVYFTLQEELLKPQAQAVGGGPMGGPMGGPVPGIGFAPPGVPVAPGLPGGGPGGPAVDATPAPFKPADTVESLVRQGDIPPVKQQIAEVLLTSVRPKPPARWTVDPAVERRQKIAGQVQQIGWGLTNYASQGKPVLEKDARGDWKFKDGLLAAMPKDGLVAPDALKDPFGQPLTLETLGRVEKQFTPERLGRSVTLQRMAQTRGAIHNYGINQRDKLFRNGRWTFPNDTIAKSVQLLGLPAFWKDDAWGTPLRLVDKDRQSNDQAVNNPFVRHEIASAGPDGKFGTKDDIVWSDQDQALAFGGAWFADQPAQGLGLARWGGQRGGFGGMMGGFGGGMPGMPMMEGAPMADAARAIPMAVPAPAGVGGPVVTATALPTSGPKNDIGGEPAKPVRLREFFPETMLWQPALITDEQGRAELPLNFADSITTWRLTASANSRGGALGGLTTPLRVFQDFFVDLDLPIALTQNDEVAFPVAVYNYLKTPQTVRLDLQVEPWFDLLDPAGPTRSLDLKPGDVVGVKFRIKAKKIGQQPLTVKATGSQMSDAIKRSVEVVPDGKKVEEVVSDKLAGKVKQTLTIPDNAVPDASKLIVKLYPGVFSQVLEGTEGMLRMPGG